MNEIINFCELNNVDNIVAHIDLTHRTEEGYPDEKNIHTDPTIHFLKNLIFRLIMHRIELLKVRNRFNQK